jgi:hypothetical protein
MNTTTWNELAQVYDEKCEVLEKAREAYRLAIDSILKSIANDLNQSHGLDEEIKTAARVHSYLESDDHPSAPLRKSLEYIILGPHGEPDVSARVRFSSPWEQRPGTLHLGLLCRDPKLTEKMADLIHADEWAAQRTQMECTETDWIYSDSIKLSEPDLIPSASKLLQDLLRLAYRVQNNMRRNIAAYRMEWLLAKCRRQLEFDPKLRRDFPDHKISGVSDWGTPAYRYVQLDISSPSPHRFWVGHDANSGNLVFGDNRDTVKLQSELQAALQETVNARNCDEYFGCPGGTIMDASQLAKSSDQEVLAVMLGAFETYQRVVASGCVNASA